MTGSKGGRSPAAQARHEERVAAFEQQQAELAARRKTKRERGNRMSASQQRRQEAADAVARIPAPKVLQEVPAEKEEA
jgi:hypothetical protein